MDNACFDLAGELSVRAFSDYGLLGDNTVRLRVPLSNLLEKIHPTFPTNRINLNHPVKQIIFNEHDLLAPCSIECENGQIFTADHVIVTVSLGVLKSSPEMFVPALPLKKQRAIECCGFGSISKLVLEFPCAFWKSWTRPLTDFNSYGWMMRPRLPASVSAITSVSLDFHLVKHCIIIRDIVVNIFVFNTILCPFVEVPI